MVSSYCIRQPFDMKTSMMLVTIIIIIYSMGGKIQTLKEF